MLTRDGRNNYNLDDWRTEFAEIYGNVNKDRSVDTIWLHAVEHASELHEDLRIGAYQNAFGHLANLFCWLCAFTTKAHIVFGTEESLLEIVLCKYPRICFYCGGEKCFCSTLIGRGIEDLNEKKMRKADNLTRATIRRAQLRENRKDPKSLKEVVEMFQQIYDHINFYTPLELIMAHLQEEVGEVATCINNFVDKKEGENDKELRGELEHEIADIVTWSTALFWKLDYMLAAGKLWLEETYSLKETCPAEETSQEKETQRVKKTPHKKAQTLGITFPDIIWKQYQTDNGKTLWCPHCKERSCTRELIKPRK